MRFFLLISLALKVTQSRVSFEDSFIVCNSDFDYSVKPPRIQIQLDKGTDYLLYAASAGSAVFNADVAFKAVTDDQSNPKPILSTLQGLASPDDSGRLWPLKLSENHTDISITINSDQQPPLPAMVFYFVKLSPRQQGINPPPVFDATRIARNISIDRVFDRQAVTFLSAAPRFSLHAFDIGGAIAAKVYTVGWESVIVADTALVEPVLNLGLAEVALKSFVTITGPIATLFRINLGPEKYSVAVTPMDLIEDFQPGAIISAPSPGFISSKRAEKYETFDKGTIQGNIHFDWASTTEVQATIDTKIFDMKGTLSVASVADGKITPNQYTGDTQDYIKEVTASKFIVVYYPTAANTELVVFLVQITTQAATTTRSPSTLLTSPDSPMTSSPLPSGTTPSKGASTSPNGASTTPTSPPVETTTSICSRETLLLALIMNLLLKMNI